MGCCFSEPVDFDGEVTLYHFDLHRAVGKGAFGKVGLVQHMCDENVAIYSLSTQVRVVEHKRSKQLYALKYIDKARCLRQKAVANIIQERRLLEEVIRFLPLIPLSILRASIGRSPIHCKFALRLPR
jgi:serine/threonine kinase 32